GTFFYDPEAELNKKNDITCTVNDLLLKTSKSTYNEVVITGKTVFGEIEVVGFFKKTPGYYISDEILINPPEESIFRRHAHKNELPFIQIREVEGLKDEKDSDIIVQEQRWFSCRLPFDKE
ncbi:hypothetical protein ACFL56_03890, partial [Candidatus Margulisiibacteriota bacterium]